MNRILSDKFYKNIGRITIYVTFFLIFLGGLVRITGSGMGCPDWPLCYGQVIPPTSEDQLPEDYQTRFAKPGKPVAKFNVWHTYTEWINRDMGAITGILFLFLLISSFQYIKTDRKVFVLTLIAFLLVMFQAWIGAKVVMTNLQASMVSVHLYIAYIIMAILMLAVYYRNETHKIFYSKPTKMIIVSAFIVSFLQIVVGANVRELVDSNLPAFQYMEQLDSYLGITIDAHKIIAVLVFLVHVLLAYKLYKQGLKNTKLYTYVSIANICIIIQIITGTVSLFYLMPPVSKLIHMTIASLLMVIDIYMCILVFVPKINTTEKIIINE